MLNSIYQKNFYELDFNILTNKIEPKKLQIKKKLIFFLIYKHMGSKLLKNDLKKINKNFYFKKIKINNFVKNDEENDSSRIELLFGHSKNISQLSKDLLKVFNKEKSELILKHYKTLTI